MATTKKKKTVDLFGNPILDSGQEPLGLPGEPIPAPNSGEKTFGLFGNPTSEPDFLNRPPKTPSLAQTDPSTTKTGIFDFLKGKGTASAFPLLAPVEPTRRRRRRSNDPFDFFGTLFTNPATQGLNPTNV